MLPIYSEKNERFILKILLDCKKKKNISTQWNYKFKWKDTLWNLQ